jgi:hypothetical protein
MSDNIYYVYQYWDPIRKEPFYIGKGCKRRAWTHLSMSRHKNSKTYRTHNKFYNRINWIRKQGQEPIVTIKNKNLSKENYGKIETYWITKIGRDDLGKGPLTNLKDRDNGVVNTSLETRRKISKNHADVSGKNNPMFGKLTGIPKLWLITFPDGHREKILGLNRFCKQHKLTRNRMKVVAKGLQEKYKGFTCSQIEK